MKFLARILVSALALYLADYFIPGVSITGGWITYLIGGVVLAALFTLLRPLIKLIASPLILLTFGLFNIVIVMFLIWLADLFLKQVTISGFLPLLWTTIIIEAASILLAFFR